MRRGAILVILASLLLVSPGCIEELGYQVQPVEQLYVCPTGESVSDPNLCPKVTIVPSTASPEPTTTASPTTLAPTTAAPSTTTQPPKNVEDTYHELQNQYLKESREFGIYYEAGNYGEAKKHAIEAKRINAELLLLINENKYGNFADRDLWSVRELIVKGNDYLDSYRLKIIDALESKDTISDEEFISKLKSAIDPLLNNLNTFYLWKKNYPHIWSEENQNAFNSNAMLYEQLNQMINRYYDSLGDLNYKYYYHINPNDPTIIKITDELTTGLTDKNEIKWTLLNYVRTNVNYKHDPKWQTDWIRPPAYTITKGWGDCDDIAVLLHSLYLRSGVDSKFALVDTDGDGYTDHAAVTTIDEGDKRIIWDATCANCPSSAPPDVEDWVIDSEAKDIDEYLKKYPPIVWFYTEYTLDSYNNHNATYRIGIEVHNDGRADAKDLTIWVGLATEEGMIWDQDLSTPKDLGTSSLTRTLYLTAPRGVTTRVETSVSGSNFETLEDKSDWFNTLPKK
ncbi:MAG: transglutaminase domain-containing protein [Candidatus Zixiibacteriota bacterium]